MNWLAVECELISFDLRHRFAHLYGRVCVCVLRQFATQRHQLYVRRIQSQVHKWKKKSRSLCVLKCAKHVDAVLRRYVFVSHISICTKIHIENVMSWVWCSCRQLTTIYLNSKKVVISGVSWRFHVPRTYDATAVEKSRIFHRFSIDCQELEKVGNSAPAYLNVVSSAHTEYNNILPKSYIVVSWRHGQEILCALRKNRN